MGIMGMVHCDCLLFCTLEIFLLTYLLIYLLTYMQVTRKLDL